MKEIPDMKELNTAILCISHLYKSYRMMFL